MTRNFLKQKKQNNDAGKIPLTWSLIKNFPLTHRVWYIIYTMNGNIGKSKDGKYHFTPCIEFFLRNSTMWGCFD
ncbi:unnamed protein product [Trifolium pratense]|uniref:Uncharacterized protein n=1 Tax=Trifolium pratense TaxID=57577 RepID=A0ACB0L000_TRIPR|nr:unnamed protein product [Trifolium pratense]